MSRRAQTLVAVVVSLTVGGWALATFGNAPAPPAPAPSPAPAPAPGPYTGLIRDYGRIIPAETDCRELRAVEHRMRQVGCPAVYGGFEALP